MGLDIRAYCGLTKVSRDEVDLDEDGYPTHEDVRKFYVNPDFADRAEGIDPDCFYDNGVFSMGFRAGSYSGYSYWRATLAHMAGYGETSDLAVKTAFEAKSGPFWELICFTDCEGVIGPVVAKKLAQDFRDWDEKAKTFLADQPQEQEYFYGVYREFTEAMEMAQDNGAVVFC